MDRREFAAVLPALFAGLSATPLSAASVNAAVDSLPQVESGMFRLGPAKASSIPKRASRAYTRGLLKAGNIQLEAHVTTQEVGAPHEPIETHLHNEIYLIREGTVDLTVNGVARRLVAGDMGICVAGDKHYIQNAGDTPATYLVVAIGPPE